MRAVQMVDQAFGRQRNREDQEEVD